MKFSYITNLFAFETLCFKPALNMSTRSQSRVDDFDVLKKLGSGSFGKVYKVRRKEDEKLYVIKNIAINGLTLKEQKAAISECAILSRLDNP